MEPRRLAPTNLLFRRGADLPDNRVGGIEGGVQPGLLTIKPPLIVGEHVMFLSAFKEKGLHDPLHQHDDHESIGFQLKGRQRVLIDGQEFLAEEGDAWYHPAGVIHMSEALEDTIQLEMKSPPMRTWGDVEPSGPLDEGAWVRAVDASGRRVTLMHGSFTDASATPAEDASRVEGIGGDGATRITPLVVGRDIMLSSVVRERGAMDPLHQHDDCEEIGYCISGRLRLTIDGEVFEAGPGDSWYHPRGVAHFTEALEESVSLLVTSPPTRSWGE